MAAIVAALFATIAAWWKLRLPRVVFSPEGAQIHARIEVVRAIQPDSPSGLLWPETATRLPSGGGTARPRARLSPTPPGLPRGPRLISSDQTQRNTQTA